MKIYWKSVLWNYTIRYWHLLKYYYYSLNKTKWSTFYYPHKRIQTKKEMNKMILKLSESVKNDKYIIGIDPSVIKLLEKNNAKRTNKS